MAHEKVYGICDSKCRVEVMSKEQSYGISKIVTKSSTIDTQSILAPEENVRYIFENPVAAMYFQSSLSEIRPGFLCEIIFKLKYKCSKPSDVFSTYNAKILNDDLDISNYDVLHFTITHDGFNFCAWCSGYAD